MQLLSQIYPPVYQIIVPTHQLDSWVRYCIQIREGFLVIRTSALVIVSSLSSNGNGLTCIDPSAIPAELTS